MTRIPQNVLRHALALLALVAVALAPTVADAGDVDVYPWYEGMDPDPVPAGDPTFGGLRAWADDERLEQEVRDSANWTWQVVGIWYNMESSDPEDPNWVEGECDDSSYSDGQDRRASGWHGDRPEWKWG